MEWLPIESAPTDGTPILLGGRYVDHPSVGAWSYHEGAWVGQVDGRRAVNYMSDFGTEYLTIDVPDFWMPLPPSPHIIDREI